jgi:hypothetical protein
MLPDVTSRDIVHGDALAWLDANPARPDVSVVTSLPDVSELELGFDGWREWFVATAARILRWIPDEGVAIFYQSDIRRSGTWVDKGFLVQRAGEETGAALLWHRIVCRRPAGTPTLGRASYSHMLCFAKAPRPATKPAPDVLPDAGTMPWSKAMGAEACRVACRYLLDETRTRVVVDPFCGKGTVLAVANELGLDAIGVERSAKRCRAAKSLVVT